MKANNMKLLDPAVIKFQIDQLLLLFPELAEDEILRSDTFESETSLFEFLSATERKRQEATFLANAIDMHIENLKQRMGRFERRDESLRHLMFSMMQAADLKKAELPEATLSIRVGTPKVIITDEAALPDSLCRFRREPDKTKIKEALQNGSVTGAVLSNAEATLAIRTK